MILRVKNWREFQHYKGRRPPWIKLHHGLLDNRAFLQLPIASRALAPMLWLIASERDGEIPDAISEITFRLRMSEQDARDALAPLLAGEFFDSEQDASDRLAERKPLSGAQERREEAEETKAPLGLSYDSDVEKPCPVAARGSLGGSAHDDALEIPNFLKRMPS